MTTTIARDRQIAIGHAPAPMRQPLETLFALDDRLAGIVRATREPMIGQMRLTWWHDALVRLDSDPAPAEPLLQDIQHHLLPMGISGARLAGMIDGWEELIVADTLDPDTLERHAAARGGGLFAIIGSLLGADAPLLAVAGRGWALADLATHLSMPAAAALADAAARDALSQAFSGSWPAKLRPVGVLALIAHLDRSNGTPIGKVLRVARFRISGR